MAMTIVVCMSCEISASVTHLPLDKLLIQMTNTCIIVPLLTPYLLERECLTEVPVVTSPFAWNKKGERSPATIRGLANSGLN